MKSIIKFTLCILCFFLLILNASLTNAVTINLNDFYADPSVVVSPDGSSATLYEDPALSTVLLSNDPFFGDPGVFIPSNAKKLRFDYDFSEGANNTDEFYAFLFDPLTHLPLTDSIGNNLELLLSDSQSGTVNWSLAGASFLNQTVGMEFQLNAFDLETDSFASINNVDIITTPIPEPSTILLLGFGILGSGLLRFRLTKR